MRVVFRYGSFLAYSTPGRRSFLAYSTPGRRSFLAYSTTGERGRRHLRTFLKFFRAIA
jgi:hypothetical protein